MKKLELLQKLKRLENVISDTEKEITSLSIHIQPYFKRDIYSRLEKYGFTFVFEGGQKILRKSL